ncbi:Protein of unknown function (DUF1624) [Fragilaria crotonensis]|nr:Protein of unknown function (DUF1624) [Fragilaria crotonensis]
MRPKRMIMADVPMPTTPQQRRFKATLLSSVSSVSDGENESIAGTPELIRREAGDAGSSLPHSTRTQISKPRDSTVDIARGVATLMMIYAHYAALVMDEELQQSLEVRLIGTFAAPLFIVMSGMMVGLSIDTRGTSWQYFLQRGMMLVMTSSLVLEPLIFKSLPFALMDVLCLIGIALPLTCILHRRSIIVRCLVTVAVFAITPWMQTYFAYREEHDDYDVRDIMSLADLLEYVFDEVPRRMFIDGSFPLFPWIGFSFAGSIAATWRWGGGGGSHDGTHMRLTKDWGGILLTTVGALIWYHHPGPLVIRNGFCEMFYPPTSGYSVTAFGVVVMILAFIDRCQERKSEHTTSYWTALDKPLITLGRCSLVVYLLQYAVLYRIVGPSMNGISLTVLEHAVFFASIVALCQATAEAVNRLKQSWKSMPFLLRFLFGS